MYFGDGLYGVEAASLGYFGKHADDLSIPEAALLAGLVKSPSAYGPRVSPALALARRNLVLQAMVETRAITQAQAEEARRAKLVLNDALRQDEPHGLYFKEQVRLALVERFGWERVYQGGLRVYTTIDLEMQEAADRQVAAGLAEIDKRRVRLEEQRRESKRSPATAEPADAPPLQAALVALEPATGDVRAMVGGRDYEHSRFNRAVQARRQPGLGIQAVRVRRCAGSGLHTRLAHRRSGRTRDDTRGRMDARRRALDGRGHDAADRAAHVQQPRRGAAARSRWASARPSRTRRSSASGRFRTCRRSRSAPAR